MIEERKKRHYVLLSANSAAALSKRVQEKLDDGWKPWGSPFCNTVALDDIGHSIYQSAVKEEWILEE
jgi:hypothetical protein